MYYTEYLPRLNSISILIEDKNVLGKITAIKLKNENHLLIKFEVNEIEINLPLSVKPNDEIRIASLNKTEDCLQVNISLSNNNGAVSEKTESFMNFSSNLTQKWSCMDLKNKTPKINNKNDFKFCCLYCSSEVIDSNKYDRFFDMPSELWTEMMEFWHCHKPAESGTQKNMHRDYDKALRPSDRDVIVGSYYFLLNRSCQLPKIDKDVKCPSCNNILGEVDDSVVKLLKWNLSLSYGGTVEAFPSYIYVYNLIVDKINLSALRKFKVKSDSREDYIFIWVLNIGVDVSTDKIVLENALKVFYYPDNLKNVSNHDDDESIESIVLLNAVFLAFQNKLEQFNDNLPSSKRNVTLKVGEDARSFKVSFINST